MVQAAGGLEEPPAIVELPLHNLELEQVPEDELVLRHGCLAHHNAKWPVHLHKFMSGKHVNKQIGKNACRQCLRSI